MFHRLKLEEFYVEMVFSITLSNLLSRNVSSLLIDKSQIFLNNPV